MKTPKPTYEQLQAKIEQLESKLHQQNSPLSDNLTDRLDDIVLIIGTDHRILDVNKKGMELFGRTKNEITGKACNEIICGIETPAQNNCIICQTKNISQTTYHDIYLGQYKSYFKVKSIPIYDDSNQISYFINILHNTSREKIRKVEEKKARNSLNKAELIANIGHWEFELNTNLVKASQGARKIYGLGIDNQTLTIPQAQALPLPEYRESMNKRLQELIKSNAPYDLEFKIKRKTDGEIRYIHSIAEFDLITNTVFGVIRDITAQKMHEIELGEHIEEYAALNEEYKAQNDEIINAQKAIIRSEKRFRTIFDISTGLVCLINLKTLQFRLANPAFAQILGFSLELIVNQALLDFIHPNDKEHFAAQLALLQKTDKDLKIINRFRSKSGAYKWIAWNMRSSAQDNTIYTMANDITELKEKERQIKQARDRFASLVNHIQTGVLFIDNRGNILETNPALLKILGSPSDEATKKINIFNFKPLIDFGYTQKLKECIASGKIIHGQGEYVSVWDKKTYLFYYFVPIFNNNQVVGVLASVEDITLKKQNQEQLEFQATLLDSINDYITATDLKGNITYANKKSRDTFDLPENTDTSVHKFGEDKNRGATQQEIIENTIKLEKWRTEVVNITPDKQQIILDCRSQLLRDKHNKPYGLLGISTDITLQKQQEHELELKNIELKKQNEEYLAINEELDESLQRIKETTEQLAIAKDKAEESNQLKTAFLNNISHEFRTPMNGILGFSEMLIRPDRTTQERQRYADFIQQSCERLLDIVTDTVELSEIHANATKVNEETCNLKNIIEETIIELTPKIDKKDIEIVTKYTCSNQDLFTITDKQKIYRSIKHILDNAIKFTYKGTINIKCATENNNFLISIRDTGIGIQPDLIQKVFEPYRQAELGNVRRFGGNGIGLALVKSYIQMLGGNITLNSQPDTGTEVILSLPHKTESEPVPQIPQDQTESQNHIQHNNILIVEDEYVNYLFIKEVLDSYQAKILHANDGAEAVSMVREHPEITLILMDIKMPRMNGYEATKKIKTIAPHIIIIAQTAYAMETDLQNIHSFGFDDYLVKPIKANELIAALQSNKKI